MGYSFDGINKIISLTSGTTTIDVRDMYSRWKDWAQTLDGIRFLQAMYPVGGEPIDEGAGRYVSTYIFLLNEWRIRPQEADHTLSVENAVLLTDTGDEPFVPTLGTYNVLVEYAQPIYTETVVIGGGSGGLTEAEHDQLMDTVTDTDIGGLLTVAKFLALK